jgi:cytoskeletal protein RodZ
MAEIGATLREARMRARIDISEIEAQTKIRAKYLRALENEEWDLLPGPTYVKSFLRTYADALGLDGKRLVEEYKLQHERLSDVELQPIAPPGQRRAVGEQRSSVWRRVWAGVVVIAVLVAALYFLGRGGGDDDTPTTAGTTTTSTQTRTTSTTKTTPRKEKPAKPERVRLQIVPTADVYVCLESATGERLINGLILSPGGEPQKFRSKRFLIGLGNGSVVLRMNGKAFHVPDTSDPVGYELTTSGAKQVPESRRPTCAG